jgi:pSer/pThr/pTyr-binding forkhead associated (FHA) protein
MPKITITDRDGQERRFRLEGKLFTVGRAPDNDLVLDDPSCSNYHAALKLTESGDFSVSDLGSTNHTRVNGHRVTSRDLRDEDRVLFGDTLAVYQSEVEHPSASATQTSREPGTPAPSTKPDTNPPAPPGRAAETEPTPPPAPPTGCLGLAAAASLTFAVLGALFASYT